MADQRLAPSLAATTSMASSSVGKAMRISRVAASASSSQRLAKAAARPRLTPIMRADGDGPCPDDQRDARADHDLGEQIAAEPVGAGPVEQ